MALTRNSIIRGPCQVSYAGKTTYTKSDVRLSLGYSTFDIVNSAFGTVENRVEQRTATVEFEPVGVLSPTSINFWDYGTKLAGDPFLPADQDNNLVIWSYYGTGTRVTIFNASPTKLPDLILATTKTVAGPVTFTGLGKGLPSLVDQDTPDSFAFFEENVGKPSDDFNPDEVITETYSAHVGSLASPWDDLHTAAGWTCSFDLNLQPVTVDSHGLIDWTIGNVTAKARAQLIGITETQAKSALLTLDVKRGTPIVYNSLVIAGTHINLTLTSAAAKIIPMQWGLNTLRLADVEFTGVRTTSGGKVQPVYTLTIS